MRFADGLAVTVEMLKVERAKRSTFSFWRLLLCPLSWSANKPNNFC